MASKSRFVCERIVVVGRVRAQFLGQPWIEVIAACPAREQIPLGTVLHASRAIDLTVSQVPACILQIPDQAVLDPPGL